MRKKRGLRVTGSGIHDFLRRRSRQAYTKSGSTQPMPAAKERFTRTAPELREGRYAQEGNTAPFEFDPSEPLKLK